MTQMLSIGTLMGAARGGAGAVVPVSLGSLADSATADGAFTNWYASTSPAAIYVSDDPSGAKIALFNESINARSMTVDGINGLEVRARLIDYATKDLLGEYYVANDHTIQDDSHGVPAGCVDRWGYYRVFYGAHATVLKAKRSALPWRVDGTWVDIPIASISAGQIDPKGGYFTYPKPIIIPGIDKIFLFARGYENPADTTRTPKGNTIGTAFLSLMIFDIDSSGNTTQNGNRIDVVDFRLAGPTLARFYSGNFAVNGSKVYIPAAWADAPDAIRRDVYVFILDLADGDPANFSMSNVLATRTDAYAAFPVNLTNSKTYYRIVNMETPGTEGTTPTVALDTVNWAPAVGVHVFYTEGVPLSNTYQAKHRYHDGTALQAASVISNQPPGASQNHAGCCGYVRSNGEVIAQTVTDGGFNLARGGSHSRARWTKAGGWEASIEYMRQVDAARPYDGSILVFNGPDDAAIGTTQLSTAVDPVKDGMLRGYISGASLRAPFIGSQYGPEIKSLIERMNDAVGSKPDATWCGAAKVLNETLRDNGLWTRFYGLWVPFVHASGAALLNWRSSRFPLSVTGAPVFTAYGGYKCVSGGYFDSGIPANTLGDTSFGILVAANGLLGSGFGSALAGTITTANNLNFANNSASSLAFNKAASAGTASVASAGLDSAVMIGDRTGTAQKVFENGVLRASATATNAASNSETVLFGRRLTVSSAANMLAMGLTTGVTWTEAETLIVYNALKAFLNAKTPGTMA